MAMPRCRMDIDHREWLDTKIRNGPGVNNECARRAWKKSIVELFFVEFSGAVSDGDDRKIFAEVRTISFSSEGETCIRLSYVLCATSFPHAQRVKKYIDNHTNRVLGIPIPPRRKASRRAVKTAVSAASSPSSSSTTGKRARSFRDHIQSSDPLVIAKIKNLGVLEKQGAITKALSMRLRAEFINWRMESQDVQRMRVEWEGGGSEIDVRYVCWTALSIMSAR